MGDKCAQRIGHLRDKISGLRAGQWPSGRAFLFAILGIAIELRDLASPTAALTMNDCLEMTNLIICQGILDVIPRM